MAGRLDGKVALISGGAICLALFLLMSSTVARGEDGQDSSKQIDCSRGDWDDVVYCAAQDAAREEERLNVLVNELRPTFDDDLRAKFDEFQQEWLGYRERRCLFERAYFGIASGTRRQEIGFDCMRAMTEEWLSELRGLSSGVTCWGICEG